MKFSIARKTVSLILSMAILFAACPAHAAECRHTDSWGYPQYGEILERWMEYPYWGDWDTHVAVSCVEYICDDCGEIATWSSDWYDDHVLDSNDVCTLCGYTTDGAYVGVPATPIPEPEVTVAPVPSSAVEYEKEICVRCGLEIVPSGEGENGETLNDEGCCMECAATEPASDTGEEETWTGYERYQVDEYIYIYQISSQGNARLKEFQRDALKADLDLIPYNIDELMRKLDSIVLTLPSEIDGMRVTAIANFFLFRIGTPSGIILPDEVETIGGYAFAECEKLSGEVLIPQTTTMIGAYAFSSCPKLESVYIPHSVTLIEEGAFTKCPKLVLTVEAGSLGESYAIENEIPYVYSDGAVP